RRHAPHGVFGVSGGVKVFAPLEMARELPRFANQWPIVFITRRDIVAQAVSEAIALTTRAYKASTRPSRILAADDYDAESIARSIDASLAVNAGWEGAFLHYRIEPLRLAYEDLIADPEGVTARAAQFIDIDGPPVTQKWLLFEPLRRQADALNEAWIARFRAEQSDFCDQREAGFFRLDGSPARAVEALATP
ncbi:MAG: Stf0 family sulfotransferase, partial [Caulobacteraceae bacterium]